MARFSLLASLAGVASGTVTKYDAITNVISHLEKMGEDGAAAMQAEEVQYTKFKTWSDNMMGTLADDIDRNTQDMNAAQAAKEKAAEARDEAQKIVDDSNAEISSKKKAMENNKKALDDQTAVHVENQENTSEAIMACDNAIQALKAMTNLSAGAFLQFSSKLKTFSQKRSGNPDTTKALIQELKTVMDPFKNPTMFAQEPTSGPGYVRELKGTENSKGLPAIVEMIETLMAEFEGERDTNAAEHRDYVNQYEREKANNADRIKSLEETVNDQETVASEQEAIRAAEAKAEQEAAAELAENTKLRDNLDKEKQAKDASYAKSQTDRQGEITAIKKAIEILSDVAAQGLNKHLGDAQTVSFIQLSSRKSMSDPMELSSMLREKSRKLHSQSLAQIAMAVEEGGPFDKIIGMIEEMILNLETAATKEADHHAKCTEKYDQLDREHKRVSKDLKEGEANLKRLNAEIQTTTAKLEASVEDKKAAEAEHEEATSIRIAERAENTQIIADAEEGKKAVEQATKVLEDYYASISGNQAYKASMGKEDEFRNSDTKQEFNRGDYTGQDGSGVIGILQVVKADSEQLINDKTEYEAEAQAQYKLLDEDLTAKIAKLGTSIGELKLSKMTNTNNAIQQTNTNGEHTNTLDVNSKERGATDKVCQVQGVSYEERAAARAEEIQSLKEAYKVLGDGV